jgi:hypothetical protein
MAEQPARTTCSGEQISSTSCLTARVFHATIMMDGSRSRRPACEVQDGR